MIKFSKINLIVTILIIVSNLLYGCNGSRSMNTSPEVDSLPNSKSVSVAPVSLFNRAVIIGKLVKSDLVKILKNSDIVTINSKRYSIGALKSVAGKFDKVFNLGENTVLTDELVNSSWGSGNEFILNAFESFLIKNYPEGLI